MTALDRFTVRYWGVRGSVPTPGPTTARYGGNTTCLEVRCGNHLVIIDAGSGIRALGVELAATNKAIDAHMLFSHLHWDHIQGFPFFAPAFVAGNTLHAWCERHVGQALKDALIRQMAPPLFPIAFDAIAADLRFHDILPNSEFNIGDLHIQTAPLHHPGGATAFRFNYKGKSFVQATDHEHTDELHQPLVDLARGADYLSYDAMYTDAEYRGDHGAGHAGWGHSTWQEACKMANATSVKNLILFHHNPDHSDDMMDEIGALAAQRFSNTHVAYEGMVIDLLS
ncbi:MAG TPA: MBL fold metallo-hydrolase [Myxococcales bacterium]|nr:MBL fold metallo-hydrolase [Myxococcales bacterium]